MGLDLYLVRRKNAENIWDFTEEEELAYGRKTWTIVDAICDCGAKKVFDDDTVYEVTPDVWEKFYKRVSILRVYEPFIYMMNDMEYADTCDYNPNVNNKMEMLALEAAMDLEVALKNIISETSSYLGPIWDLVAVLDWIKATNDVLRAFDNGEKVYMLLSY